MRKYPCFYIIASGRRGYVYIGVTSNLAQRIYQHKNGMIDGYAKRRNCKLLVRYEMFGDMEHAITREKQLKNWHRQWKFNLVESENPDWRDLAPDIGLSE